MASVEQPGLSKSTLRRYYNDGGRFSLLAGGGMYYRLSIILAGILAHFNNPGTMLLLAVLAISKIKTGFHIREIMEDVLIKINHTLRSPEPGKFTRYNTQDFYLLFL